VKREDEAAFERFVAVSGDRLLRTAFLLTGDRGHAEDLVQAALERTARHWTRTHGPPDAYGRAVGANLATDRGRRRRRRVDEIPTDDPHQAADDPSGAVVLRRALVTALRTLPSQQRAVLVLRYFEDLSEVDTAAALGITVGTVKSTTNRALSRLRGSGHLTEPIHHG
jgi:RNA polymerase sigma-70 factor (sigma-E family)